MREVINGDKVRVHYVGSFADGTEFDSSKDQDPVELTIGAGDILAGLESALLGMTEGAVKKVTLGPEQAYGAHDPQLVSVMARGEVPTEINLEIGTVLKATNPDGTIARLVVSEFDDNNVTVDANHVMAGKTLIFDLNLVGFVN